MATKTRSASSAPSAKEAKRVLRLLKRFREGQSLILAEPKSSKEVTLKFRVKHPFAKGKGSPEEVSFPPDALKVLITYFGKVAQGTPAPAPEPAKEAYLTSQQAAELLGMSRPFLVGVIDRGEIPAHKVGTHRRLLKEDVLAYKAARSKGRKRALAEMARLAQEHDVGYGDTE